MLSCSTYRLGTFVHAAEQKIMDATTNKRNFDAPIPKQAHIFEMNSVTESTTCQRGSLQRLTMMKPLDGQYWSGLHLRVLVHQLESWA